MDNVKEMSKEDVKQAKKEKRKLKNKAFNVLKNFFDKTPNEECVKALKTIRPSMYGIAGGGKKSGSPVYKKVVKAIADAGNAGLNEMVLFKDFKIGRKETAGMLKRALKATESQDRVWINFTPSDGTYKVIGKGKVAPANYTGYIPVDEVTDVKGK